VISLNGLAIAALAESSRVLYDPQSLNWAQRATDRIWALAYDQRTGLLKHESFRGKAVTGAADWRNRAATLANNILDRFARTNGSFSTTSDQRDLLIPITDDGDMETPSGTSMAIELLLRLHESSGERRYLEAAERAITLSAGRGISRFHCSFATSWPMDDQAATCPRRYPIGNGGVAD
jgi:uncharacterized protein YyaL (SSP411 family)